MAPNALQRLAVLGAVTAVLASTASAASATLTTAEPLSPLAQSASFPQVSVNRAGDAAVARDAYTDGLQLSMRPAGGSWDATPQLTAPGNRVASRQVVVDDAGSATAIWGEYTMTTSGGMPMPGPNTILTARRQPGDSWSAPEQLSGLGVDAGFYSVLAAGPDGRVVALWAEGGSLLSATRSRTGAWSTPSAVPASGFTQTPGLAIDATGTATAAWQDASTDHIMSATLSPAGSWTAPVDVSGGAGYVPAMAMNRDGEATLVWNSGTNEISARRAGAGSAWGAPTQISVDGGLSYYQPRIAVDDAGRATAAWSQADLVGGNVQYDQMVASRAADGTWGAPIALSVGSSDTPTVSAGSDGDVAVVWRGIDRRATTSCRRPHGARALRGRRQATSRTSAPAHRTPASTPRTTSCSSPTPARAWSRWPTTTPARNCAACRFRLPPMPAPP